jgi:hypothetical protein
MPSIFDEPVDHSADPLLAASASFPPAAPIPLRASTFDDAAQSEIDQESQAQRQAQANAAAIKERANRGADELAKWLRELANYLNRTAAPTAVEVTQSKGGMFSRPGRKSPAGYVLENHSPPRGQSPRFDAAA